MNEHNRNGIQDLPTAERCRKIFQAVAMLDALLSPEWEYRYYSYNAAWGEGEEMASMRDGGGSHYFALFTSKALYIKGFDRELAQSSQAVVGVENVPDDVARFLQEPAFIGGETTFCLWNGSGKDWSADKTYTQAHIRLLRVLTEEAAYYREWASDYYGVNLDLHTVQRIFDMETLTPELLALFNQELGLGDLEEDLTEIGYPQTSRLRNKRGISR